MILPTLPEIEAAQERLYRFMSPTPQYSWPLLNRRINMEAWIKHENHTPVGAFKLRGALLYVSWLIETVPGLNTVVAATRGNHGQGVAMAARLHGLQAMIVVPHGNSREKNLAMQAQGAQLIEHGEDFQASLEHARELAAQPGHAMVESFHRELVEGTATFGLELFRAAPPMRAVYVPIGLGSSICGVCAARNALGLSTKVIGVVASESPAYALSFRKGAIIAAPSGTRLGDGLSCRIPNADAMDVIWEHVDDILEVTDAEIAAAMRAYYEDTHNLAEGAGAAALAGAVQHRANSDARQVGIILTGGNVDRPLFVQVLQEAI